MAGKSVYSKLGVQPGDGRALSRAVVATRSATSAHTTYAGHLHPLRHSSRTGRSSYWA